jgi:predicted nucleic acid-binding protein
VHLVVVDANVVVSAALKSVSTPALALLSATTGHKLAISRAVKAEYLEVLSRPKFAKALTSARRDAFLLDTLKLNLDTGLKRSLVGQRLTSR